MEEHIMIQKESTKKIEHLINKKNRLESRLYEIRLEDHRKMDNIGWGCGMRGYKKLASINLSKSDKIEQQIKQVMEDINNIKQ